LAVGNTANAAKRPGWRRTASSSRSLVRRARAARLRRRPPAVPGSYHDRPRHQREGQRKHCGSEPTAPDRHGTLFCIVAPHGCRRLQHLATEGPATGSMSPTEQRGCALGLPNIHELGSWSRKPRTPQFSDYSIAHRLLNPRPILPRLGRSPRWHRRSERNTRCGFPVR